MNVLELPDYTAPTRQRELDHADHTDHTDHTGQEHICLLYTSDAADE